MERRIIIPYDPPLKERARALRNNSTLSEIILWKYLKRKQILGYDFHRQKPLYHFIVDFFCNELMLAIEIDGESHMMKGLEDGQRQDFLESKGIRFLRFTDREIKTQIQFVLEGIENWIRSSTTGNKL